MNLANCTISKPGTTQGMVVSLQNLVSVLAVTPAANASPGTRETAAIKSKYYKGRKSIKKLESESSEETPE